MKHKFPNSIYWTIDTNSGNNIYIKISGSRQKYIVHCVDINVEMVAFNMAAGHSSLTGYVVCGE